MRAVSTASGLVRHSIGAAVEAIVVAGIVGALALGLAVTTGHPLTASSAEAGHSRYPGALSATPNTLHAGDYFDVSGCGYNTTYGNVVIGFTGGSWGSPLDSNGCFTIPNIPALSGDTLAPGTYSVSAHQLVRGKWVETGETWVTVVK